jgi:hypothetical protein
MQRAKAILALAVIAFVVVAAVAVWLVSLFILGFADSRSASPISVVLTLLWLTLLVFALAMSRHILLPIARSRIAILTA